MVERKKFLPVKIPLLNLEKEILGTNIESLNNKTIKIDLTRSLRGKSLGIIFLVNSDKEKATAVPKKLNLMGFFIRRMIRKGTDYVECSFSAECKNKILKIKPFMITRKKVSRRVRKALRNASKNYIKDYIKNKLVGEIFSDIISNKLQKNLSLKMKKIYPLSLCEIRVLEILGDKEPEQKSKEEEKENKEEELKEIKKEKANEEDKKETEEREKAKEEKEKIKEKETKKEKIKTAKRKKEQKTEKKQEREEKE